MADSPVRRPATNNPFAPKPAKKAAPKNKTVVVGGLTFTVKPDGTILAPNGKALPKGTTLKTGTIRNGKREVVGFNGPKGKKVEVKAGEVRVTTGGPSATDRANTLVTGKDNAPKKTTTVISGKAPAAKSGDDRRPQTTVRPAAAAPQTGSRGTSAPAARPATPAATRPTGDRSTSAPTPRPAASTVAPTRTAPVSTGGGTRAAAPTGGGTAAPRPVAGAPLAAAPATRPGAAPAAAGAKPASQAGTDAQVRRMFGDVAAFLSDPELGPILRKAASEGWDNSRLMGALTQTRFWKTKGDSERKWIILNRLDNATARRQVETQAASVWEMARSQGLNLSGLQVHDLSVNALKLGWSTAEIRTQMFSAATKQPGGLDTAVATQYGYLAAFLDNPEVGPLLERAAREGWTEVRLEAELQKTNFWKTTTESQRRFNAQLEQDPASAQQSISARASELLTTAQSLGVTIDPVKLKQIAEDSLRFGWNDSQIRKSITAEFDYQGGESGVAGQSARQIRNRAAEFLVPISDAAMEQWTEKMVRGEVDMEGFDAYLIENAKSLFPGMAGALDRGITVAQYADPYKQTIARELELNPEDIDFMDPKWRTVLDQKDAKGNRVSMTLSESAEYVRKMPEWQQTRGANEKAASLTEGILKTFGAVA